MFASTVTVPAAASSAGASFISVSDKNVSLLSAIVLKQCRVPSTFSLPVFLTYSFASARDFAAYQLSVLYSIFPAQFFGLSSTLLFAPIPAIGDKNDSAPIAPASFRNVLFFICEGRSVGIREGIAKSLAAQKRPDCIPGASAMGAVARTTGPLPLVYRQRQLSVPPMSYRSKQSDFFPSSAKRMSACTAEKSLFS